MKYGIVELRRTKKHFFVRAFRVAGNDDNDNLRIIEATYELGKRTGFRINNNHEMCVLNNGYPVMHQIRKHLGIGFDIYEIG